MTERNDGEPAFPLAATYHSAPQRGMTLRDYFAGQALANPDICRRDDDYPHKTAYSFADAMIEARKETT